MLIFTPGNAVALQLELIWGRKGAKAEHRYISEYDDVQVEETIHLDYLEMPILFRFPGKPQTQPDLFAVVGIYTVVRGRAELKKHIKGKVYGTAGSVDYGYTEDFSRWSGHVDAGLIIGGGLEFDIGRRRYMVDIRYSIGMAEVLDVSYGHFSWPVKDARTRALQLSFCFTAPTR